MERCSVPSGPALCASARRRARVPGHGELRAAAGEPADVVIAPPTASQRFAATSPTPPTMTARPSQRVTLISSPSNRPPPSVVSTIPSATQG